MNTAEEMGFPRQKVKARRVAPSDAGAERVSNVHKCSDKRLTTDLNWSLPNALSVTLMTLPFTSKIPFLSSWFESLAVASHPLQLFNFCIPS
jgi:hypothetical protein